MYVKYALKRKGLEQYESVIPWEIATSIFDDNAKMYNNLDEVIESHNKHSSDDWEICVITISIAPSSDVVYGKYNKAKRK